MRLVLHGDLDYPKQLQELAKPPTQLQISGRWPLRRAKSIAIVGSRAAQRISLDRSYGLAALAAKRGWTVLSGGALGVDAAAHEGALAAGGDTVSFVPGDVEAPYPARNASLFLRIVEGGGTILSGSRRGAPPRSFRFVQRNSLLATLADLVVVVEAGENSGALDTARKAHGLGRKLAAYSGSAGTDRMVRAGAIALRTREDALDLLAGKTPSTEAPATRDLSAEEKLVLDCLTPTDGASPQYIARRISSDLRSVTRALAGLELEGLAQSTPGCQYVRAVAGARGNIYG